MNHLAHAYLSGTNPQVLIGNLMGDFVKGPISETLHEDVQRGVRLHRLIDSYTDTHPVFHRSRERLEPPFRRYAGILVDIFYDHFLSRYWSQYSERPLPEYAQDIYRLLEEHRVVLPEKMNRFVSYMVSNDVLVAYGNIGAVAQVLHGMSHRMSHDNPLAAGVHELQRNYDVFRGDFEEFFPGVVLYTESLIST